MLTRFQSLHDFKEEDEARNAMPFTETIRAFQTKPKNLTEQVINTCNLPEMQLDWDVDY